MITYRTLNADEINPSLFEDFDRTQIVTKCWRKIDNQWVIKEDPFIDNWTPQEYIDGTAYLKKLVESGGYAVGAFYEGKLKGFTSVEPEFFGKDSKYLILSNIHVSNDMRRKGIGEKLFLMAKEWAKDKKADKLYISAHSAVESQDFYKSMGCVEAEEYNRELVEREPYDCQLECRL